MHAYLVNGAMRKFDAVCSGLFRGEEHCSHFRVYMRLYVYHLVILMIMTMKLKLGFLLMIILFSIDWKIISVLVYNKHVINNP